MHIVAIAWIYVALMMAVAEAQHPNGSALGAIITFVLYGVVPVAIVLYIMGTPHRRRARKTREAQEAQDAQEAATSAQPDAGGHAATDTPVPPV